MIRKIAILMTIVILLLSLSGCFAGSKDETDSPAGLFLGIWHGWIAPFALILEIFNHKIRIYEVHNRGFLYDLGFYMAIIAGFGGLALSRRKKNKK
ncbi:MAG: hypothetical protein JXR56_08565 [Candidatus Cloacimonetes bacterium]|nr:hypothetical protein [Candidatus Cloacimonadota bacterium]